MKVFKNVTVGGVLTDILVKDGKFLAIGKTAEQGFDCEGLRAYPGLCETHAHGCLGFDTMEGGLVEMSRELAKHGVTSWYPTTMTMPVEEIARATATLPETGGAKIRGYHLEGPCFAEKKKGAQNGEHLKSPAEVDLAAIPNARLVTLAPELAGAEESILRLKDAGIVVCIGHTEADYDCACRAFDVGASCLTHTFNAMPPMLHRAPGPIGAAVVKGGYAQVITDGFHIHPAVVLSLYKMFGPSRMVIISDMLRATGLADGEYSFGGQTIYVKNGEARLADGVIAGSTTYIDECVRRAISFGIPEQDAFRMASATPADMMGIKAGKIQEGYEADFALYDDTLTPVLTVVGGEIVYQK